MRDIICDDGIIIGICVVIGGGVIGCILLLDRGINLGMHLIGGKDVVNFHLGFMRCSVQCI